MPNKNKKGNQKQTSQHEALKEAGNKAFLNNDYELAIEKYSQAIQQSADKPNHIYFANRANAFQELGKHQECLADCCMALSLNPLFIKAHYRKAKALMGLGK